MNFKSKKQNDRYKRLLPNGVPRYIRCYDNMGMKQQSADNFTVVFTGHYNYNGKRCYIGMSSNPFHPCGIGHTGESDVNIDFPSYGHLGKKIKYEDLPEDCRKFVVQTYHWLWDFVDNEGKILHHKTY